MSTPRRARRRFAAALLALAGCALGTPAGAHLLNMTRATLTLEPGAGAEIAFEIDLTRAFPDRAAYHAASRLADPVGDAELRALARRLLDAVHLETPAGDLEAGWRLTAFEPERAPLARYEDPFHWPMTVVRARATAPVAPEALRVRFDGSFPFEEPIALTIEATVDDRRMTRWLVVGQHSPVFAADAVERAAPFPGPGMAAPGPARAAPGSVDGDRRAGSDGRALDPAAALRLGFRHILPAGPDHVLFVVLMVLLCRRARPTLVAVTLFTLAHAITLTLTLLGWVGAPPAVGLLIAASVCWLALEVLRGAPWDRRHGVLVLLFGLLHGLGFAAAVKDAPMAVEERALGLLALNAGVEAAQIVVALATLAVLAGLARTPVGRAIRPATALAAMLLALSWILLQLR